MAYFCFMDNMQEVYTASIRKQFEYYKLLGDKTFSQLKEDELFWRFNESSNSVAVIVNHLSGNMKSRWTDFLISDGEKDWRDRDKEFQSIIKTKEELLCRWQEGWNCLFGALDSLNPVNFETEIFIRNQSHTVIEALNRQLAHYAYHLGQIVYLGKMIQGDKWESLSITKGKSNDFNQRKFAKGKHGGHFSDDVK